MGAQRHARCPRPSGALGVVPRARALGLEPLAGERLRQGETGERGLLPLLGGAVRSPALGGLLFDLDAVWEEVAQLDRDDVVGGRDAPERA